MTEVTLASIELQDFKSFSGHTIIPVRPGFTTITGPNGSGKSNLLDAILFGLGLSGSRSLRAERLTDLISNASRARRARVAIRFAVSDGEKDRAVEIAREVKESSSGYQASFELDGHVTTRTEIHEVLQRLGIHPGGYNVIQQGDVTRIITMTPVERRRIIDDLAGVGEYDARIASARAELDQAERHVQDTDLILGEIASHLDMLRAERDTALRHRSLKETETRLRTALLRIEVEAASRRLADADRGLADRRASLEQQRAALVDATGRLDGASAALVEIETRLRALGDEERLAKVQALEAKKGEVLRHRDEADRADDLALRQTNRGNEIQQTIARTREKQAAAEEEIRQANERLDGLDAERRRIATEMKDLRASSDARTQALADRITRFQALRQETEAVRRRKDELDSRRQALVAEVSALGKEAELVRGGVDQGKQRLAALETAHKAKAEEVSKLEWKATVDQEKVAHARHEVEACRLRAKTLDAAHRRAHDAFVEAEATARAMGDGGGGGGRAVRAVIAAGQDGVRGTVADLCRYAPEHALALESAAGGRLYNIVCDTDRIAADCVEMLKRNRIGRATFLPLNKLSVETPRLPPVQGKGIVGWALRLVEADAAYGLVVAYVFGETLVVETMDDALPLIGRYRMVTLDGDLLERRGVITGGHMERRTPGRSVDLKGLAREVDRLAAEIREHEKVSDARTREFETASEQARATRGELAQRTIERDVTARDIAETRRALDQMTHRLHELVSATRVHVLSDLDAERQAADALLAERESVLKGLEAELETPEGEALAREIAQRERDLLAVEQRLGHERSVAQTAAVERGKAAERLSALDAELQESRREVAEEAERAAEAKKALAAAEADLERLKAEVAELEASFHALGKEREAAQRALDACRDAQAEIAAKVARLEAQVQRFADEQRARKEEHEAARARAVEAGVDPEGPLPRESRDRAAAGLADVEREIAALGAVNMLAIEQYDDLAGRKQALEERLRTLHAERDAILQRMAELEVKKLAAFREAFTAVESAFRDIYRELAEGEGILELENPDAPFEGGLVIRARPRGKQIFRLEAMSGGEKSLTALSFVFALQSYCRAPFYALDEVDQFLDGANTSRLALLIRRRSEGSQFMVVSLRQAMVEVSHRTIGVVGRKKGGVQVTGIAVMAERTNAAETPEAGSLTPCPSPGGRGEEMDTAAGAQGGDAA